MPKKTTIQPDDIMRQNGIDPAKIKGSKTAKKINEKSVKHINNPIANNNVLKQMWISYLTQIDMRQWTNVLVWKNSPNGLTSWLINQMLYYRGSLVCFKYAEQFYLLPYSLTKGINIYGLPNAVQPITYNGATAGNNPNPFKKGLDCIINNYGDLNDEGKAVILYSAMPVWSSGTPVPTYAQNITVIEQMADILCRVNIQIKVSNQKIMLKILDGKQAESIYKQLDDALSSDSAYVVVAGANFEVITIQPNKSENASDLWLHMKSFNDVRNMSNGVPNDGFFDKKERKITDETEGANAQTSLLLKDRLLFAQTFLEQVIILWPELSNWTVEINPDLLPKEVEENDSEEDDYDNAE